MPASARHSAELYSLRRAGQEQWLTLEEKITCHTCCKSSALTNAYGISQLLLGFIFKDSKEGTRQLNIYHWPQGAARKEA